jgi:hypothetical protein
MIVFLTPTTTDREGVALGQVHVIGDAVYVFVLVSMARVTTPPVRS